MDIRHDRRAVGAFPNQAETESALLELKNSGFPMDNVSVVAHNSQPDRKLAGVEVQDSIDNKADEGAVTGAVTGGTVGGITGLLVGLGTLAIPGVGPILLAGTAATAVATTLAGAAIGAGGASLLGALIGLGIPDEDARTYTNSIERGDYLVVIDGTEAEIQRAQAIFAKRSIRDWQVYDIAHPNVATQSTTQSSQML
jgi:hypothetical protein